MAAISYIFTLSRAAQILGEDEDWLDEISEEMDPEDGRIWVMGTDEWSTKAFSDRGMECLKEIIEEYERQGRKPG